MIKSALTIGVMVAVFRCAAPLVAASDVAAGKDGYAKKCSTCHGPNGEGKDTIAQLMKITFKNLGSKEIQSKSDAELKKIALEGMGKMKPVKDLNSQTADDIIAYLRTLAAK